MSRGIMKNCHEGALRERTHMSRKFVTRVNFNLYMSRGVTKIICHEGPLQGEDTCHEGSRKFVTRVNLNLYMSRGVTKTCHEGKLIYVTRGHEICHEDKLYMSRGVTQICHEGKTIYVTRGHEHLTRGCTSWRG